MHTDCETVRGGHVFDRGLSAAYRALFVYLGPHSTVGRQGHGQRQHSADRAIIHFLCHCWRFRDVRQMRRAEREDAQQGLKDD